VNLWVYHGTRPDGARVSGKYAGTREELLKNLAQEKILITSLTSEKEKMREGRYTLALFFADIEQLHYLVVAGLPLAEAVLSIIKNTRRSAAKKLWSEVLQKIKEGVPFSTALIGAVDSINFGLPSFYANILAVGEEVGDLKGALKSVIDHLTFVLEMKKEVRSAFAYPAFLLAASGATLLFMVSFILPRFSSIYSPDELLKLPWVSRVVLGAGAQISAAGPTFYIPLVILLLGVVFLFRIPALRHGVASLRWRIPYLQNIALQLELSNLFSALGMMLKGGVDLNRSLQLAKNVISNPALFDMLDETVQEIKQGRRISQVWGRYTLLPEEVISLVTAGEAGARLPEIFSDAGLRFMANFKNRIKILLTLLEPLIIMILGLFIAVIVVAIMLAVVGMSDIYG